MKSKPKITEAYTVTFYRSGHKPEKEGYDTLDRAVDHARRSGNAKVVHTESRECMAEFRDYQQTR